MTTLAQLSEQDARMVLAMAAVQLKAKRDQAVPRPMYTWQVPPPKPWGRWFQLGGRGTGKTEGGARYVDSHAKGPACLQGATPHRIAVIAPSHDDAVDTDVRGETGLLFVNPSIKFRPGSALMADLTWPNGAEGELFGAFTPEDVERLRGPQHCLVWGDEVAAWRKLDDVIAMMEFGLRLGPDPHAIFTTTPKRREKIKELLALPDTVKTTGRTEEAYGLPEHRRRELYDRYGGTTMGRQELDAETIEDVEGALWKRSIIRFKPPPRRENRGQIEDVLSRVVISIDPAASSGDDADETGIIAAGVGEFDGLGYVLDDLSGRMTPMEWARVAVRAYHERKADRIVAEANNGGEMVEAVIRTIDPSVSVRLVHASRGKRTRAEPVAALYEQSRVYHVVPLPILEDQLCVYTGAPNEGSPDRMDALVWAMTDLMLDSPWVGASDVAVA